MYGEPHNFCHIKQLIGRPLQPSQTIQPKWPPRLRWVVSACTAFSLVEVTLAIGITSVALLVIFSLMPIGMSSLQASTQQIVSTEIYNTVGAEFDSTSFDQLDAYVSSRYPIYFDNEGIEVGTAAKAVFTVTCTLSDPASTDVGLIAGELRRAKVSINSPSGANLSRRPFLLVKRGT